MVRLPVLVLLLVSMSCSLQAEPLNPRLSKQAVDSLQTALRKSKPDTNRVNLLLTLSNNLITNHEEWGSSLDSTYAYIQQAQRLSASLHFVVGQVRTQCALGRFLGTDGQTKEAEKQLQSALLFFQKQGLRQQQATTWYFLGQIYGRTKEELPKKIGCYQQAMKLFSQLGQTAQEAYMLKTIADMHGVQGNIALAQRELFQALNLYKSIHYPRLHYTYDLISSIYHGISGYDEALNYGLLALESAVSSKDTIDMGSFYLNLAILYDELKQWQTATDYYKKSLVSFAQINNVDMVHVIANNICGTLTAHGSPEKALAFYQQICRQYPQKNHSTDFIDYMALAECHLALKHVAVAESYYLKMLAIGTKSSTVDNTYIASYLRVGSFYVAVNQYQKARPYLNQVLTFLDQKGISRGRVNAHLQLFKVDSAQGNYKAAIAHYQTYKALSDSIFNEKKSKQIANLEIQYNIKKKEQDIALLTRKNLLQQASIQQKDLQRNSIFASAILLTGLLGVSYNRYRLKRRSNKQLETKQLEINQKNQSLEQVLNEKEGLLTEKEWMLKEIHHRVKNNLQVISSMLNAQSDFLSDPTALMAIRESQNRVHAMALIHQKLYQSDTLALVNMPDYIQDIMEYLIDSFDRQNSVSSNVVVSALELDVSLATPLGLIINEAVTNSLKYAFPQNRRGLIRIDLNPVDEQTYLLTIQDDGIGLPAGFDISQSKTLGLTMIQGLSEQIGGQLQIANQQQGVQISLQFSIAKKSGKPA